MDLHRSLFLSYWSFLSRTYSFHWIIWKSRKNHPLFLAICSWALKDLMKGYIARYSIELKGRIYAKSYGFLSFPKNMEKNLSIKYGQKLLDTKKKLATDARLPQRGLSKKRQKQRVIWLEIRLRENYKGHLRKYWWGSKKICTTNRDS